MRYVIPAIIFLVLLPLVILGAIFYMRRKQMTPSKATGAGKPQQGNAPSFTQVPGTVAAIGGAATATAQNVADSLKSLKQIVGQFVPDDSNAAADPSQPISTPFYDWGSGLDGTEAAAQGI